MRWFYQGNNCSLMDHENNSDRNLTEEEGKKTESQPDSSSESQPVRFEQIETDENTKTVEVRRRRRRRTKQPKKEKKNKIILSSFCFRFHR